MITRRWVRVCSLGELEPGRGVAALVEGRQVAIFLLPDAGGEPAARLRAIDNLDPTTGVNVLSRGLIGSLADVDYVASPLHKARFDLATGRCLDGTSPGVRVWPVRVWANTVEVLSVTGDDEEAPAAAVSTHCPFCALQCGMRLTDRGPALPVEVAGDDAFPVNEGRMCVKGWSSPALLRAPERLAAPLIRNRAGRLVSAGWEEALDELGARLMAIRAESGPQANGVFGSGALSNEKAYLLGKFARLALATPHVDYNGRYCMSSAAAAQNRAYGLDRGLPFPLADVARTDTLVLWGANPADTMPPLMAWVDRMRARGGRLVVIDPRRSATAAVADLHVQPVPGSDLALALGLLARSQDRGLIDRSYLEARTTGWEEAVALARAWTPGRVREVTGVDPEELDLVLDALAGVAASILLTGRGPEQQSTGVDTVSTLINLMLALGRVGRPASGYGCLTGQANGQGGREHGQKADQLPGYRSIADAADRAAVAAAWGVDPAVLPGPGYSAVEMIASIGEPEGVRSLLVAGSDIALASPAAGWVEAQLGRLDCLAVLDSFPGRTAELAHFVLPVTQWAEEDGTVTSLEGRVLRRRAAVARPPGVRTDLEVLVGLAHRLGAGRHFGTARPEEVFAELARVSAGGRADYSGISYRRLDEEEALHWPCPKPDHPGTPRLFADSFAHPDGRARLAAVDFRPPAELPDSDFPLWFTTGRYREHYNSGNQTRRLVGLTERSAEPRLQMNPRLAARMGVVAGDLVAVSSRRGQARFRAEVSDDVRPDVVFAPIHWGGAAAANRLTNPALDPVSRMPEFKLCTVAVSPAPDQ